MGHNRFPILTALVLAASAAAPAAPVTAVRASGALQADTAKASIPERLKRISADLFTRTDRVADAVRELKEILALDPNAAEAHLLLGIAYRAQGSAEMMGEAIAEFRQALALNPKLIPAHLYLAHAYMDLGRLERARDELQGALALVPGNAQFLALAAETERRLANPKRAVDVLQEVLQKDASFAQARYYLGLALFDLGRSNDAIKELEQVVKSGAKVADAYLSLGVGYLEADRLDEGLEILSQATHLDPGRTDIRIQLARAYRLTGSLDNAEKQLAIAEQGSLGLASPFSQDQQTAFELLVEQGQVKMRRGDYRGAAALLQRALDMDPAHAPTLRLMADVKRKLQPKLPAPQKKSAGRES